MGIAFRVIIFLCFYCVLPILYFMLRNETRAKKNIILGVTVPFSARESEGVRAVCESFRKKLGVSCAVLTVLAVAGCFLPWDSVFFTFEMTWLLAAIAVPFVLYARSNLRLASLKRTEGWRAPAPELPPAALSDAENPGRPVRRVWLLLPVVLTLVPPVLFAARQHGQAGFWALMLTFLSFTAVAVLCERIYYVIYRRSAETVDERHDLNRALTDIRRRQWGKSMLLLSWSTSAYDVLLYFMLDSFWGVMLATGVYTVLILAVCIGCEFSVRRRQEALTADSGAGAYLDEDSQWLWGLIYDNPRDSHLIKNDRVGLGTTVNLARPAGKAIMALSLVCLLAMPFLGVWMMAEEFTPVTVSVSSEEIDVAHLGPEFSVPLSAVTNYEVLSSLPRLSKRVGTAMDDLCKGTFQVEGYGSCRLCLDPRAGRFLVLRTADETYLISPGNGELARILSLLGSARQD